MSPWNWLKDNYGLLGWLSTIVGAIFTAILTTYHYMYFKPEMEAMKSSMQATARAEGHKGHYIQFAQWCAIYDGMDNRNGRQEQNYKDACEKKKYYLDLMKIDYKNGLIESPEID